MGAVQAAVGWRQVHDLPEVAWRTVAPYGLLEDVTDPGTLTLKKFAGSDDRIGGGPGSMAV
jgi:hypothetical protein